MAPSTSPAVLVSARFSARGELEVANEFGIDSGLSSVGVV